MPPPPPLPAFRVQEAPPFTNTGVDFASPLYIRNLGKVQSKAWIVLYTCCVTRAIHLELVSDNVSAHLHSQLQAIQLQERFTCTDDFGQ